MTLPWKSVAHRLRRWFKAELAGSLRNKRDRDQAVYRLWLVGLCAFCGSEFGHGEEVIWMPDHHRGYCLPCRDSIDASEREEAELEARAGPYAVRGVAKGDFYR